MLDKWIERLIAFVGMAALASYTFGILARYVFTSLVPDWTEEITVYALLWGMLLAGSLLVNRDRHLSAGIIHIIMPRAAPYLDRLGLVVAFAFCVFFTWQGFKLVQFELRLEEVSRSSLQAPLGYVYAVFPVAMALMAFRYIQKIFFTPIAKPSEHAAAEKH